MGLTDATKAGTLSNMDARTRALVKRHVGEVKWQQGKTRAVQLVKDTIDVENRQTRVQWSWGDLSLEIIPIAGPGGDHSLAAVLLGAFIEDYKVPWSKTTMHSLRQTAAAWPKSKRAKTSFAVHKILKSHPDRFKVIFNDMTVAQAMEAMGRKPIKTSTQKATAIECANAVKSWSRALEKRVTDAETSDDLLAAVSDAWGVLTGVVIRLGLFESLIDSLAE